MASALAALDALHQGGHARVTPMRRRVLEILLESHAALGAYEILERLGREGVAAQPPVAYRALEFLTAHGFVHKIERLNAFVACVQPARNHDAAFLVCRDCGKVAEAAARPSRQSLAKTARETGFVIEHTVIEAVGLCAGCQPDAIAPA